MKYLPLILTLVILSCSKTEVNTVPSAVKNEIKTDTIINRNDSCITILVTDTIFAQNP